MSPSPFDRRRPLRVAGVASVATGVVVSRPPARAAATHAGPVDLGLACPRY